MGIRTDPGYSLFGDDCILCYPANLTPKKLYASFGGITGPHNNPGNPTPPNGLYVLEQRVSDACVWEVTVGAVTVQYLHFVFNSQINLTIAGVGLIFGANGPQCSTAFENPAQGAQDYTFGSVIISPRERDVTPGPTIQGTMALMAVETGKKVFCELIPESETAATFRIADQRDKTRVHIKVDPTFTP